MTLSIRVGRILDLVHVENFVGLCLLLSFFCNAVFDRLIVHVGAVFDFFFTRALALSNSENALQTTGSFRHVWRSTLRYIRQDQDSLCVDSDADPSTER